MPRPRVRDEDRKRVAQACDTCKRRKEKCDGQHPCLLCKRRGREPECTFTDGSSARRGSNKSLTPTNCQSRTNGNGNGRANNHGRANSHSHANGQLSPLDPLLRDSITVAAKPYTPYMPPETTSEYPPIEASSINLNNAYQPSASSFDGTTNSDREIAIESLLTLSSGPATQTRPSSGAANPPPPAAAADNAFNFPSQPGAVSSPDQNAHAHQSAFSQHPAKSIRQPQTAHEPDSYSRAPVPKLARLLKDGHGKFVFVGDSSNLAFLQNIRRLVKSDIGESGLTSDPLRHAMVENIPPNPSLPKSHMSQLRKPSLTEAKELLRAYALATSGIIDLFDIDEFAQSMEKWFHTAASSSGHHKSSAIDRDEEEQQQRQQQQQSGVNDFSPSTYYLVLAIGMQLHQPRGLKGRELKSNGNGNGNGAGSNNNSSSSNHSNGSSSSGGGGSPSQAEIYLQRGRELVNSSFMDDPSLLTVQSYILIVFYMLTVCRRNGAFMLLGIAVRAAYALGLHRRDISVLFEAKERRTRERVWKSLRALDLFMSASLGRPPATSEIDGGSVSWDCKERSYEGVKVEALDSSAMLRMWFIFERILNEVYCRREIRVQLVESISRQYRDWTLQLPVGLRSDGLDLKEGEEQSLVQTIGVAHLKMAYYWSIILLTRPFLIFKVSGKIKARKEERHRRQRWQKQQEAKGSIEAGAAVAGGGGGAGEEVEEEEEEDDVKAMKNVTTTLSEACIDAALRSVEIATDLIHTPGVPKRLFMISNSGFVSAMVIGFAIFGEFDRTFPLLSSIDQAIAILSILAQDDPSSRRYEQISTYLRQAAAEHIRRREESEAERRAMQESSSTNNNNNNNSSGGGGNGNGNGNDNLFINGNDATGKDDEGERPAPLLPQGILIPQDVPIGDGSLAAPDGFLQQEPWQLRFDMQSEHAPILTTSGTLAANGDETGGDDPFDLSRYAFDQSGDADSFTAFSGSATGKPDEFPLFSLLTEYDELQDPYSMMVA